MVDIDTIKVANEDKIRVLSVELLDVIDYIKGDGQYTVMFWLGQWIAYILPMLLILLSRSSKSENILKLAAILALVGLAIVKHVWLIIPQLLPMS